VTGFHLNDHAPQFYCDKAVRFDIDFNLKAGIRRQLQDLGSFVTIPNLITITRLFLVPVVVWLIGAGQMGLAFWVFVIAGISDAVDGFIAKRFGQVSELGAYLDPLADKALLVSIYIALGFRGDIPPWLVITVVSRDVLIIGAVMLSWMMDRPVAMQPLNVSKANTTAQIVLASVVLGAQAFAVNNGNVIKVLVIVVAITTVWSAVAYLIEWTRHMAEPPIEPGDAGQASGGSADQ